MQRSPCPSISIEEQWQPQDKISFIKEPVFNKVPRVHERREISKFGLRKGKLVIALQLIWQIKIKFRVGLYPKLKKIDYNLV